MVRWASERGTVQYSNRHCLIPPMLSLWPSELSRSRFGARALIGHWSYCSLLAVSHVMQHWRVQKACWWHVGYMMTSIAVEGLEGEFLTFFQRPQQEATYMWYILYFKVWGKEAVVLRQLHSVVYCTVNWKELQRIGQFGTPWLVNLLLKKKTQEEV